MRPKQRHSRYLLPNLPELKPGGNRFNYEGKTGYAGSIIRCRMPGTPFWHYGLIYGYDSRNTLWIIDNTGAGVLCRRFIEFTGRGKIHHEVVELLESPEMSAQVIERVKEFSIKYPKFNNWNNNCEMMVSYAYGREKISWQMKLSRIFGNFLLSATEMSAIQHKREGTDTSYIEKQMNEIRSMSGLPRLVALENLLSQPKKCPIDNGPELHETVFEFQPEPGEKQRNQNGQGVGNNDNADNGNGNQKC